MFKHKYLFFSTLLICFASCKKDAIKTFSGNNQIFFEKFFENEIFPGTAQADSTTTSFFFYPDGTQHITVPLIVSYSGISQNTDFNFSLKVVNEGTTAVPSEYTIDPNYRFRGGVVTGNVDIRDTIYIKINRSARLDVLEKGISLVVELMPNDVIGLGQLERRKAKMIITSLVGKPTWWTTEVTNSLLGTYSEKKYKLFLNEIDKKAELNTTFIKDNPDNAKKMALSFKTWLNDQNPRILEVNGEFMTVPI